MSGDILRNYEQQFGVLCADITNKISRSAGLVDKKPTVQAVEALFQEARELIEQMELEIRDATQKRAPEQRDKYMNIINGYTSELGKLETEFNRQMKSKSTPTSFEIDLDRQTSSSFGNNHGGDRDDLELNEIREKNKGSLLGMNSKLENSYKMILETEETGKNILSDLFGQREQVERARDRLRESNMNLGKSSRIVSAMSQRLMQNKLILFGLCAFLLIFVIFILYLLVRKLF
jgi:vesicle transport through interaction with t-SNAREs protein 1